MVITRLLSLLFLVSLSLYGVNNGEWYIDQKDDSRFCYKDNSKQGESRKQAILDKFNNKMFPDENKRGKLHSLSNKALSKGYDFLDKFGFFSKNGRDLCIDYDWAEFGRVKAIDGKVTLSKSDPMPNVTYDASFNELIFIYDTIKTGKNSKVVVDGKYIDYSLPQDTVLNINQELKKDTKETDRLKISLLEGAAIFATDSFCKINKSNCMFETKSMALGIRGTTFKIDTRGKKELFYCMSGEIYIYPKNNPKQITYIQPDNYAEVDKKTKTITLKAIPPVELEQLKREVLELEVDDSFIKEELVR